MITIAKASAGSGKTYTLAKTYISLLLKSKDPYAYRHILAVTFTNKATGEMKARILRELDILAHAPAESDYFADFVPALCPDAERLRKRCETLLNAILNDYSAFSVFTIDRFFQQVLRSFARELGQFDSYRLELDKSSVVGESVDRMLENLSDKDGAVIDWLQESMMNQISSNGYFKLEDTLYSAAGDLQSPQFKAYMSEKGISDPSEIYSKENMRLLRKVCNALTDSFAKDVEAGANALEGRFCGKIGETSSAFAAKGLNKIRGQILRGETVAPPSDAFCAKIADRGKLFAKAKASLADELPADYEAAALNFLSLFYEVEAHPAGAGETASAVETRGASPYYRAYRTALQIRDMIYGFGVSRELSEAFSGLLKERNILCLEDSNGLLSRIIDGSDVPFVYEKTGVRYEHFLLDEFQDTSLVQWDNFRPLLRESDSNGNGNLIVGDVKQSIYRWRQSDWNLLNSEVGKEFPDSRELLGKDGKPALSTNYRTEENIVEFNNLFFEFLRDRLAGEFRAAGGAEVGEIISGIYADVRQAAARKGGFGEIRLCFASSDGGKSGKRGGAAGKSGDEAGNGAEKADVTDKVLERTVQQVLELHENKGAGYGDIAVIVRNNAPGERIANALMERGVPVISDDSLTVDNSIVVRRLVSVLSSVENPENKASGYLAASLKFKPAEAGESSLVNLAESIIRSLRDTDGHLVESHALYLQAFMDWMQSWVSDHGNSLKEFLRAWDEKNSVSKVKIASPAATDAVRIITIHKSKGLEFPYVIIPYFGDIKFFRHGYVWAEPSVPGGLRTEPSGNGDEGQSLSRWETGNQALENFNKAVSGGIFKPDISAQSRSTYFEPAYNRERLYQCIDAMNLMYVAMTRPSRGLCIICGGTSSASNGNGSLNSASDALFSFASAHSGAAVSEPSESASAGTAYAGPAPSAASTPSAASAGTAYVGPAPSATSDPSLSFAVTESDWGVDYVAGRFCSAADLAFRKAGKKPKTYSKDFSQTALPSAYPSWPADSSRLRIDRDAADFFSADGTVGTDASRRLRGIVLHNILSSVVVPADLDKAVRSAVESGELTEAQSGEALGLLRRRILDAQSRGWFTESPDEVLNERPTVTSGGEELRPDRVSIRGGEVLIIDYKFGRPHPAHRDQVRSYMETWRALGHTSVRGCLWYVPDDTVIEVEDE